MAALKRDWVGAILAGLLAAGLVCAVTARIDNYESERHRDQARSDALHHAAVIRARLEGALNARLHLAHGLAAYARSHPADLSDFDRFAEGLAMSGIHGIRSLQLAPGAVVRHVYPVKGNERAIGHDLLADPSRRETVERSIRERLFVVAGPVPLMQGGTGIIARYPLYIGAHAEQQFWGFATVVLDVVPVLQEGGLMPPLDLTYAVALRGVDGLAKQGAPFFGDQRMFDGDHPVLLNVSLPHGAWQLALMPVAGWPGTSPYSPMIWAAGLAMAALLGAFTSSRVYAPVRLRKEVARATRALRETEEQFRSVAESASDAIVSVDAAGVVAYWNKAAEKIFLYGQQEAVGRRIDDLLMPPRGREDEAAAHFIPTSEDGPQLGRVIASVAMRKGGAVFPIELTLAQWSHAGQTYVTAIIRDVSRRKAFEREQALLKERYFQAQKMEAVGTLASGAAHEFNNILNSLIANAEQAMSELTPDSPAMPSVCEVLDKSWRAAEIVRQLLVFSEKDVESVARTKPSATLKQLLGRIDDSVIDGITLETVIAPSEKLVAIGHDQFCHVVWNLAMNAVRAMLPGPGTLRIALAETAAPDLVTGDGAADGQAARLVIGDLAAGPCLELSISDSGRGMDSETLARAFEPFFTTANVGSGTGLGLSVVLGIVQSHGGAIAVTTRPGAGTTVDVYFPALDG